MVQAAIIAKDAYCAAFDAKHQKYFIVVGVVYIVSPSIHPSSASYPALVCRGRSLI